MKPRARRAARAKHRLSRSRRMSHPRRLFINPPTMSRDHKAGGRMTTDRASNSTGRGTAATSRGRRVSKIKPMAGTGRSRSSLRRPSGRRNSRPMEATGNSSATADRCASGDRGLGMSSPMPRRKAPKRCRRLRTPTALPPARNADRHSGERRVTIWLILLLSGRGTLYLPGYVGWVVGRR